MTTFPPSVPGSRPRRISVRGLFIAAIVSVLTLSTLGSTVNADTPQPDGPPDGGDHSWCYLSGFSERTAADAAMTRLREQTDVTTNYPGSCGAKTDVRWTQGDLGGSFGRGECIVRLNGSCDVYRITLAMGTINNTQQPVNQRSKTSCHELGHTVGVRHYSDNFFPGDDTAHSCLRSGEVTGAWTNITLYGNHHRTQHINITF